MFLEGAWLPTLRLRSDIDAPTATGVKNEASRVSGQMTEPRLALTSRNEGVQG